MVADACVCLHCNTSVLFIVKLFIQVIAPEPMLTAIGDKNEIKGIEGGNAAEVYLHDMHTSSQYVENSKKRNKEDHVHTSEVII
jgi:hypothetical protein